ncbi:MAG: 2-oxoglutarate dehydrogenase complex dihydrolipoyllysine-residue succinyltransferase [Gammaproteobacteria bacterium]
MTIEVKVPQLPESVADATIITWHKKVGETIVRDENIVDLETDKVVLEVPAPQNGVLKEIMRGEGDTVVSGDVLAKFDIVEKGAVAPTVSAPANDVVAENTAAESVLADDSNLSPVVRRLIAEHHLDAAQITGTGKGGRLTKKDVEIFLAQVAQKPALSAEVPSVPPSSSPAMTLDADQRPHKRVPMSRLRARVAERLLQAQHNAAILTTFNEVDLSAVMDLRAKYKDRFEKRHGARLGFMSFFTKAVIEALKRFPAVNASIDGQDVIYHGFYDIGVAVSTERGLVVPVLRDADSMSMAEIEKSVVDYATRARDGKLSIDEMQGGTFTITNGGVFGSLLSTPIINPPQTGILGMHKIEPRAVVVAGEVVVRPMMYVAFSYDHRLIDGKESVQFLVNVKQLLEDPACLLLDV